MSLPKGVHHVAAGGRDYFYWHPGRGTPTAGKPVRLPNDPHTPEFWVALRKAQGADLGPQVETVNAGIDAYEASNEFKERLAETSQKHYRFFLAKARAAWGALPLDGLRPTHIKELMSGLPAPTANAFLGVMGGFSKWALDKEKVPHSLTEGVRPFETNGGHKPWSDEMLAAAQQLPEMLRREVVLMRWTGQRGSDVVRLAPNYIDEGGFALKQQKTGREVWCPILPELAEELARWERRPGPYLYGEDGKPFERRRLTYWFAQEREKIPELRGATLHGLRATAVISLRRSGLTPLQIEDIVGMSLKMIKRYCRFADRKTSGKAALVALKERRGNSGL